jgi:glycosyltransferase involved in cell wall biosynthesis
MTRVSIVTPVHRAGAFIRRCLASIAAQTIQPAEVVLVDDGTTPGLTETGGLPVRVVPTKAATAAGARNDGLAACCGDWVAFLDADDFWAPAKLAHQLDAARRWPEAVMLACAIRRVSLGGDPLPQRARPAMRHDFCRAVFDDLLWRRVWFTTSTVMARRSLLNDLGGFDAALEVAEDWELFLRIAQRGPAAYLAEALVDYTVSPTSLMHRSPVEVAERDWRKVLERHAPAATAAAQRRAWAAFDLHFGQEAHVAGDYRQAVRRLANAARLNPALWRVYPALLKGIVRRITG